MTNLDYFSQTSNPQYSHFIALSRYARWLDDKGRRESWEETVDRYINFFKNTQLKDKDVSEKVWKDIRENILNLKVMPSMRCLMTAGPALEKSNIAGYNCSYIVVDHPRAFDEAMFILLNGTGLGFSVERQYINKLPEVAEELHITDTIIHVADSKKGWAKSFKELIAMLYAGQIPKWDMSLVRPAGARLKTFGGRASGPEPLEALFKFCVNIFKNAAGRKLNSLECHDIMCKIADIVVVGGVRRSALISLSNLSDDRMRDAKKGRFWEFEPQRRLANNSACYTETPSFKQFIKEWVSLFESESGERGIINRTALQKQAGKNERRETDWEFGINPCSEIILRPNQFCNLSEVIVRSDDTLQTLKEKVRVATIIGTMQATLTDIPYLRSVWKKNIEDEALLGVSLTGIMDHPILSGKFDKELDDSTSYQELKKWLFEMKKVSIETNKEYAKILKINQATAITCTKPSGTISQLCDTASGIHARYAKYYIRRVRADVKDPLAQMMKDKEFPCETDIMPGSTNLVFSFPIKAPVDCIVTEDRSAIDQLEHWKIFAEHWCEHKPSVTINYKDDEFLGVGQWVWNNFDILSGISFLPMDNNIYPQAPYEKITKEEYDLLLKRIPENVDWNDLNKYELEDNTTGTQTMACTGNVCEMVDLINN
jgi:ribonucleoside-triphosphate reductase